jgi:hypothetical protein
MVLNQYDTNIRPIAVVLNGHHYKTRWETENELGKKDTQNLANRLIMKVIPRLIAILLE